MSNDFKLIAITPLKDCDNSICKNLEIGNIYQFYSNYEINISKDCTEIVYAKQNETTVPNSLYKLENGIDLSFSAVVGKNGSGKSTLFEVLYYVIYIIGTQKKDGEKNILRRIYNELNFEKESIENDYQRLNNSINILEKNDNELTDSDKDFFEIGDMVNSCRDAIFYITKYYIDLPKSIQTKIEILKYVRLKLHDKIKDLDDRIFKEREAYKSICAGLNISILYEIKNIIYEVSYQSQKFSYSFFSKNGKEIKKNNLATDINNFDLKNFFYTISLNYSHHSLNSETLGNWIRTLFHKNDAYRTPVVINPMRTNGNFDINKELHLLKERLMSTVLFDIINNKDYKILDKYKVVKFRYLIKTELLLDDYRNDNDFLRKLKNYSIIANETDIENFPFKEYIVAYLRKKIKKVDDNYGYLIHKSEEKSNDDIFNPEDIKEKELYNFIREDRSHITRKIRQTLYFIEKNENRIKYELWKFKEGSSYIELTIKNIFDWLYLFSSDLRTLSPSELIDYGLPGFLNVDFVFADENNNEIRFDRLSSGEQQIVLNTNSILYHLNNLNSIHGDSNRIAYENVNITLDEIELYFHPDMQRQLVSELIDNLDRVSNKGIKSINICVLTHSPFILSDIPENNCMFLKIDDQTQKALPKKNTELNGLQTFGANIYDLLQNGFFMESAIGDFAKNEINHLFDILNRKDIDIDKDQIRKKIELVGDKNIQKYLWQLLDDEDDEITFVDKQISLLQARKSALEGRSQ